MELSRLRSIVKRAGLFLGGAHVDRTVVLELLAPIEYALKSTTIREVMDLRILCSALVSRQELQHLVWPTSHLPLHYLHLRAAGSTPSLKRYSSDPCTPNTIFTHLIVMIHLPAFIPTLIKFILTLEIKITVLSLSTRQLIHVHAITLTVPSTQSPCARLQAHRYLLHQKQFSLLYK